MTENIDENLPEILQRAHIPESVVERVGKQIKYYREIEMRWCKLEQMYGVKENVLKRVLCLYIQFLSSTCD